MPRQLRAYYYYYYYKKTNALSWQGFQVNTQNDEKEGVM